MRKMFFFLSTSVKKILSTYENANELLRSLFQKKKKSKSLHTMNETHLCAERSMTKRKKKRKKKINDKQNLKHHYILVLSHHITSQQECYVRNIYTSQWPCFFFYN